MNNPCTEECLGYRIKSYDNTYSCHCNKKVSYDIYQQGRKDAIDEYRQMLFDSLFEDGLWRCVTENDIDTIAELLKDKANG